MLENKNQKSLLWKTFNCNENQRECVYRQTECKQNAIQTNYIRHFRPSESQSLLIDKYSGTKLAQTAAISRSDFFLKSMNQFMDNIEHVTIKEKSITSEISYFKCSDQDPILFLGKVTEPLPF